MTRLGRAMLLVAVVAAAWATPAVWARATYGARTTADEPQYLLTAISLGEDGNLDVADERADGRYRAFHESGLPIQEAIRVDGTRVSPHDPLLPALLAVPMRVGGWTAAKLFLATFAGALAALMLWTAVRRFGVPVSVGILVVLCFSLAAPLVFYGSQVYPELPAAIAVTGAIALVTGPFGPRAVVAFAVLLSVLPWLAVKYLPVVLALAVVGAVVLARRGAWWSTAGLGAGLAVAAASYVVGHQVLYGGLTPYAAGWHFAGGEATVIGNDPDFLGRSGRLLGLLTDRGFGLAAWQPAYLLAVPALGALLHRRPTGWLALALPLAAGWLGATFVALTMHGWWWPGRQVVVVLPAAVLAIAWWAARLPAARVLLAIGAAWGAVVSAWLVVEALASRLTLVVDFERTANPLYRLARAVLPDGRGVPPGPGWLVSVWLVVVAALATWGWCSVRPNELRLVRRNLPIPA